jgi:hypothetical protein
MMEQLWLKLLVNIMCWCASNLGAKMYFKNEEIIIKLKIEVV